jgi:hypothetical protein
MNLLIQICIQIFSIFPVHAQQKANSLKFLPQQMELKADIKINKSCSKDCETIPFYLKTIPNMAFNEKPNVKKFITTIAKNNGAFFTYRISTPGLGTGGEYLSHPPLIQELMNQLHCDIETSSRKILSASEVVFQYRPEDLPLIASLTQKLFEEISSETRRLGKYDEVKNRVSPKYPLFKPLHRYIGFSCYQSLRRDEDGVDSGIVYYGMLLGDEVDFSEEAQLPSVASLSNVSRLGFLFLFQKNSWE